MDGWLLRDVMGSGCRHMLSRLDGAPAHVAIQENLQPGNAANGRKILGTDKQPCRVGGMNREQG